jgi:hypothetical protein
MWAVYRNNDDFEKNKPVIQPKNRLAKTHERFSIEEKRLSKIQPQQQQQPQSSQPQPQPKKDTIIIPKLAFETTKKSLLNIHQGRKIPKNIFRTFKHDFNESVKKSWTDLHPDYNYYFFNDNQCMDFMKYNFSQEIFDTYKMLNIGAPRADLFRVCILYLYGGVYVDIDCECVERIDKYIKDYDFVCPVDTERARYALFNAFMASSPRNNILYHMIQKIVYHVRNKFYQSAHHGKGDAFSASGPGTLGSTFANLIGKPYKTLFYEGSYEYDIPRLTRLDINHFPQHEDSMTLNVRDNNKQALFYYEFSDFNDCEVPYNFTMEQISSNQYKIEKTRPHTKGWDHKLSVALEETSSRTFMESFYFGNYNYHVGSSDNNEKEIEINHSEYDKLDKNLKYLKIDFLEDIRYEKGIQPKFSDFFTYEILGHDRQTLRLKITRMDCDSGWGNDLKISIYYSSLQIQTDLPTHVLSNAKLTVYDFLDYLDSKVVPIEVVASYLNYHVEPLDDGILLVSIKNYDRFLPVYTIINIVMDTPDYPESQKIYLPFHEQSPDTILIHNKLIINSQILQSEKNQVIQSYTERSIYSDFKPNYRHLKVAVVCSFDYHYEIFGCLLQMNKNWEFYAPKNDEKGYVEFWENLFQIRFKCVSEFRHENYDIIINHSDDSIHDMDPESKYSDKYIAIEHEYHPRCKYNNLVRFVSLHKYSIVKRPIITPCFNFIDMQTKMEILSQQDSINIISFNNLTDYFPIGGYTEKLSSLFKNTCQPIHFYYRHSLATQDLIEMLQAQPNITLIPLGSPTTLELMNYYKICHYSLIGNEHLKYSGSIGSSLSAGCQLIASEYRIKSLHCHSAICFQDMTCFTKNIDLKTIYQDIEYQNQSNQNKFHHMIFGTDLL